MQLNKTQHYHFHECLGTSYFHLYYISFLNLCNHKDDQANNFLKIHDNT